MNKITKISGEPVKYEILNEQNHQISGEPVKYEILNEQNHQNIWWTFEIFNNRWKNKNLYVIKSLNYFL